MIFNNLISGARSPGGRQEASAPLNLASDACAAVLGFLEGATGGGGGRRRPPSSESRQVGSGRQLGNRQPSTTSCTQTAEKDSNQEKDWQLRCKYTMSEVQQHSTLDDCWMVIFDKVYNISEFVDEHPGGDFILLEYAGRDATHPFLSSRHGSSAYKMLDKYWIGILVDEELYYSNNSSYCSVYSNLSWRSTPTLEAAPPAESEPSEHQERANENDTNTNSSSAQAAAHLANYPRQHTLTTTTTTYSGHSSSQSSNVDEEDEREEVDEDIEEEEEEEDDDTFEDAYEEEEDLADETEPGLACRTCSGRHLRR